VDGRRSLLASADVELDPNGWHVVRVNVKGARAECFLDGKKLFEVEDETFPDPGFVGLWTKADAHTQFDDLVAVELSEKESPAGVPAVTGKP
jgi:hypothetical protein